MQGNRSYLVLIATTALASLSARRCSRSRRSRVTRAIPTGPGRHICRWPAGSTSSSQPNGRQPASHQLRPLPTANSCGGRTWISPASFRACRKCASSSPTSDPDKRELLVEQLFASPRYATHMATTWRNRILPLGVDPERSREAVGLAEVVAHALRQEPALRQSRGRALADDRRRRAGARALLPGQRLCRRKNWPAARPSCFSA